MVVIDLILHVSLLNLIACSPFDNLDRTNYRKNEIPFTGDKPVNVTVQVYFYSVGPIDEADFTFETGFYLRQWWTDQRLRFNSTKPLRTTSLDDLIWIPNTSAADSHSVTNFPNAIRTVVEPSGNVYVSRRLKVVSTCEMNLNNYPMETQTCHLLFETCEFFSLCLFLFFPREIIFFILI
ncbi:gamma-aminobutyric acid receptor subunit gamma-3-like [Hydractinia symbiolongicarpus]|uniref:gamma-aminobutyric acid receptor subunit gamma-3-like n=1 Tax=Hydractinia symbiolongicarpus TaxID=13093 RepID=UPI00254C8253|nr:gamma-aminobutyric acid receptor subunit gamma-3-like [Hydractinia symbiolongicarpus]